MDNKSNDKIDWENIYKDPQIRAVAQNRYAELNKEREDLALQMKAMEEEMKSWQRSWKNILDRRLILEQKIRAKDRMIRHVFPVQPSAQNLKETPPATHYVLHTNSEQPPAVDLKPIPKVKSDSLVDELKAAKQEEAMLRENPTATALDIALLQEKIKDLQQKLSSQTSSV